MKKSAFDFLVAVLLLLFSQNGFAQVKVYPVKDNQSFAGKKGVFYALPMTCLRVDVIIKCTEEIKGPYSNFAFSYIGLDDVIAENGSTYEIGKVTVTPFITADPDHYYFLEFEEKESKEERDLVITLSEKGFLVSGSLNMPQTRPDEQIPRKQVIDNQLVNKGDIPKEEEFRYYATPNEVLKTDTIVRYVTIDTSVVEDITFKTVSVYKTLEERAREAAERIMEIRKLRLDLLSGYQEVAYEKGAIAYMDQQLIKMEDDYLALFRGITRKSSKEYCFIVVPFRETKGGKEILFRFSQNKGINESRDNSGNPVMISFNPLGELGGSTDLSDNASLRNGVQGYFYRFPIQCEVTVDYTGDVLSGDVFEISQLGFVHLLPLVKSMNVEFNPASGNIKRVQVK